MNPVKKVREFLEKERISYQLLEHPPAFTALEVAEIQHVPGRQMVKSIVVIADGTTLMCVLPAIHKINFDKLKEALHSKEVHLASESQIASIFPNFELGAMPPFGQMGGLKVYVDKTLEENEEIAFNAGTHTDVIRIKFKDYMRLTQPHLVDFGVHV